jgi:hypothetical protein
MKFLHDGSQLVQRPRPRSEILSAFALESKHIEQELDELRDVERGIALKIQVGENRALVVLHVLLSVLWMVNVIEQRRFADPPVSNDRNGLGVRRVEARIDFPNFS